MTDAPERALHRRSSWAILAKELASSAEALRKGKGRYAKSDALQAICTFLRNAGIPETSLLPLYKIHAELSDAQDREEHPGKQPRAIKATVDLGWALATIDFLKDAGMSLDEAARKVAREVPGLGLTHKQLKYLRSNASKGRERSEMQERRRAILQDAHDNDWRPEEAAAIMLTFLRENCYVEKKG